MMINKIVLLSTLSVMFLFSCTETPNKYNLIVVLADGLVADSLGCYGNEKHLTPSINSFAEEAILFSNCYSSTSQAGPFMGMLLSGQHPLYNGAFANGLPMLPLKGKRIGEVLQGKEYNTAFIGDFPWLDAGDEQIDEMALKYGFQSILPPSGALGSEMDKAIQYIHSLSGSNNPFALILSLSSFHTKHNVSESVAKGDVLNGGFTGSEKSKVQDLDGAFAQLMDSIKKMGLNDNTIVVFTSSPIRGDEFSGIKKQTELLSAFSPVPFLMRMPKHETKGKSNDMLLGALDLMPTFLGLLGISVPKEVHGRNLAKSILNQDATRSVSIPWFDFYPQGYRGIITEKYSFAFQPDSGKVEGILIANSQDEKLITNYFSDDAFRTIKVDLKLKATQWMDYYEDEGFTASDILEIKSMEEWQLSMEEPKVSERPIDALKSLHGKRIMHFHGNNNYEE